MARRNLLFKSESAKIAELPTFLQAFITICGKFIPEGGCYDEVFSVSPHALALFAG
jgi:hypothetical protein